MDRIVVLSMAVIFWVTITTLFITMDTRYGGGHNGLYCKTTDGILFPSSKCIKLPEDITKDFPVAITVLALGYNISVTQTKINRTIIYDNQTFHLVILNQTDISETVEFVDIRVPLYLLNIIITLTTAFFLYWKTWTGFTPPPNQVQRKTYKQLFVKV